MASGAAIALAAYTMIILPGTAELSFTDVLSFIKHSDTVDLSKRILILNIVTVVIGVIMWIVILLSLILKWKHSKILAVIVSVVQ